MVFSQVAKSRQNLFDFIRSNSYVVFLTLAVLFSEAWWIAQIPFQWRIHGGGFGLTIVFFAMLALFDENFRQYNYWLKDVKPDNAEAIIKLCKERRINHTIKGDTYSNKQIGFAYLEEMVEMKLSC